MKEILYQTKQLIESNKSYHPTTTIAMTFHKHDGEENMYVHFVYDP